LSSLTIRVKPGEPEISTMRDDENNPTLGPTGTVFIASGTFNSNGPNTLNAIFGTYADELGNILDENMNPSGTTGGQPYGGTYGNPSEPNGDWDTGQQIEDCIFGSPQYP
jgi:hypothetical protein